MAKQKVVMKVSMKDEKKRSKVMQIAVSQGVTSASIEGDKVVVEGDDIDSVSLTTALRKRVGFAELVSVAEKKEEKEEKGEVKWVWSYAPPIQLVEPYPSNNPFCTIM